MIYAKPWKRLVAFLVDAIICLIGGGILAAVLVYILDVRGELDKKIQSLIIVFCIFYNALSESSKYGATFGKRLFGICVVKGNGESVSFLRALVRYLGIV